MVRIRLKRFGTQKRPFYRVVVMDARKPRDGKCIEEIGTYMPINPKGKRVSIKLDRANYWISVGAQPSDTVAKLLKVQEKQQDAE